GIDGREEATGRGVAMVTRDTLDHLKIDVTGVTVAIQGFGNVGSYTAHFLDEFGAIVTAVSDASGGIYNAKGINIPKLIEYSKDTGAVKGFPETEAISNEELLTSDVTVLIPAALGGVLTAELAPDVKAKCIVEAANNPTEFEADAIFEKKGIVVVPDILANAGGVTVSYFEWVQNRQHFSWEKTRVRTELDRIMSDSFQLVWKIATDKKVSLRIAAYILGIGRVGRATVLGGI
ncbi:MAG: glutamate dehydrogenase, partial [Gimesia sp.]